MNMYIYDVDREVERQRDHAHCDLPDHGDHGFEPPCGGCPDFKKCDMDINFKCTQGGEQ
jgi:hypothetical protein